jgi:hypothetical protein
MRLRRRKTTKLARLLVELDRASTDGRFRRRETGSTRVSLVRLGA